MRDEMTVGEFADLSAGHALGALSAEDAVRFSAARSAHPGFGAPLYRPPPTLAHFALLPVVAGDRFDMQLQGIGSASIRFSE